MRKMAYWLMTCDEAYDLMSTSIYIVKRFLTLSFATLPVVDIV